MFFIARKGHLEYARYEAAAKRRGLDITKDEDIRKMLDVIPEDLRAEAAAEAEAHGYPIEDLQVSIIKTLQEDVWADRAHAMN